MEPAKKPLKKVFVIYTTITDAHATAFLPDGFATYFFHRDHDMHKGDHIKITIEKIPDDLPR